MWWTAKTWTIREAYNAIKAGDKDAIADFGKRFPLVTTALAGFSENLNSVIGTQFLSLKQEMGDVIGSEFYELIEQTAALLMMIPLLIGYLFVQRLFVESVERSGLTGM